MRRASEFFLALALMPFLALGQMTIGGGTKLGGNVLVCAPSGSAALPTPPANAVTFTDLQNATGTPGTWSICNKNTSCNAGGTGDGTASITHGVSSPSRSGSSMKIESTGTTAGGFWNTLFSIKPALPGGATFGLGDIQAFEVDYWVYFASGNTTHLNAYEYDPGLWGTNLKYFMSMQFHYTTPAGVRLWDSAGDSWTSVVDPLPSLAEGSWHHIQMYGTLNQVTQVYTYEDLIYDGTYIFHNLGQSYGPDTPTSTPTLNIEAQLDGTSTNGPLTEYIDDYSFVVWGLTKPVASPVAGTYASTQNVTLTAPTGTLCYTTDGTTPTGSNGSCTHGTTYSAAISIASTTTLKAIATYAGNEDSAVYSGTYTITGTVATPTDSPGAGTYSSAQTVTLADSTPGATICYTTDGSAPAASTPGTCSHGTTYSTGFTVSSTSTVKALGTKASWTNSSILSSVYTITGGALGTPMILTNTYRVGNDALGVPQGGATIDSITLPQELNFYAQGTGTTSMAIPISISNCYNPQYKTTIGVCGDVSGSFTVTSMAITGTNASDFTLSGTCSAIASGSDCEPTITFTPTAAAGTTEDATLTVNYSGASVTSQTLPLTGISQTVTTIATSSCPTALTSGYYQLTADIVCGGTAFTTNATGVFLNLNGHTITYGNTSSASMVNGIQATGYNVQMVVYNGAISEGAGTNTYGANIPESGSIGYSGSFGFGGTSVFSHLTLTSKSQYSHGIQMNGGQPNIHDVLFVLNGVGNCGTVGCRNMMQGAAFYQENSTSTSGMTIYNSAQNGGPQGGLVPESAGLIAYNSLNPGNATGTNTNGFGIVGYCGNCTFADNSIMTPKTSASATRGIMISGATGEGTNIHVLNNVIGAFDNATSTEYSGCQGGGTYGLQFDDSPAGPNASSGNYVVAYAKSCTASGLRVTDVASATNTSTNDSYDIRHMAGFTTCTFNIDTSATGGCAVGGSFDGVSAYKNTGITFSGEDADVLFDIEGGSGVTIQSPTFVKPSTAASGFKTFVAVTGTPAEGGGSVSNFHFVDPTYEAGTSPTDISIPAQSSVMGSVSFFPADWTQTMQVNKTSGPAASGAVVTWTDTLGNHYTCTTNSSGTCDVVLTQYRDNNDSGANSVEDRNPYSLSIPFSGCTTYTQSGVTISAKGTKTVTLGGC